MKEEIWKDVVGYEGLYKVSSTGRVLSLARLMKNRWGSFNNVKEKVLSICFVNEYPHVMISKNGVRKLEAVHRLMAKAFLNYNNHKIHSVIDHIDNNRKNCDLSNLRIVSQRQNSSKDRSRQSKFVGVVKDNRWNSWAARIFVNGKREYLGSFPTEEQANNAYQKRLNETYR